MKRLLIILVLVQIICWLSIQSSWSQQPLWLGADLSYVNEIQDCGGIYRSKRKQSIDPFKLFSQKGANIVRVRLWHAPDWTNYSGLEDVIRTIRRSKREHMSVLLDFHYSDTWADPQRQVTPKAWHAVTDPDLLADSLYNYTYRVLKRLYDERLLPGFVQIGNEINIEILQSEGHMVTDTIHWSRNILLINHGIQAVNDFNQKFGQQVETMIHIAQPENAIYWFDAAMANGLRIFDWIGLSYYSKWSSYSVSELSGAIDSLIRTHDKKLMIVETAYPHTLKDTDSAKNILQEAALVDHYPSTPAGQLKYMKDLTQSVIDGGGTGVIYWEPAWISSPCETRWGKGSHWDNATFFDDNGIPLPVFKFFKKRYKR